MPNKIRSGYAHSPFSVSLPALLGAFVCLLLIASPLAAQVTSTSTGFILPLTPPIQVGASTQFPPITITVTAGTTLKSNIQVLTLGAPDLDFTLVPGSTTCPTLTPVVPATTPATSTCTIEIQFKATAPGRRLGAFVLTDQSGNTYDFSLDAAGTAALAAITPGVISTFAGTPGAASTGLANPKGLAFDGFGNLYVADLNANVVRKITPSGAISTFAGNGTAGFSGDGGPATAAELKGPMAVVLDGAGNVYIADTSNNVVRVVNTAGIISTYAGQYYDTTLPATNPLSVPPAVCTTATPALGGNSLGVGDGCPYTQANLAHPTDLAFCHAGNLHIADKDNNLVRTAFRSTRTMITQVGNTTSATGTVGGYNGDGELNTAAFLNGPTGIDMDAANNIYVADMGNNIIRKTLLTGQTPNPIYTVAGTVPAQYTVSATEATAPNGNYLGDGGPATSASLSGPSNVRVDPAGDIFITDQYNQVIRMVNVASGDISTIAGDTVEGTSPAPGTYGGDGGFATKAGLNGPADIVLDGNGNLYIADYNNYVIRKVDVTGGALTLPFATTTIGDASAAQDVALLNMGNGALNITGIVPPTNFSFGGTDTTCNASGQNLAAAASCVLGVEFVPTLDGLLNGSVVVSDNSYNAGTQTFAVTGTGTGIQSQTITFTNPGPQTYGVGPITLNAKASSGLPVSYSVTGPATLSNGSTLTITGAGTVTIQATQAGTASYSAATPVVVTFTVKPEAVSYNISVPSSSSAVSLSAGGSGSATINLASANYAGTVSFTTSVTTTNGTASAVVATASPVTLTAGGNGTCTVSIVTTSSAANHSPAIPWKSSGAVMFCAVLLGAPFGFRRRRAIATLLAALAISLAGFLMACGGGGSSKTTTPVAAARTYTVTVTPKGSATPAGAVTVTDPTPVSITVTVQ